MLSFKGQLTKFAEIPVLLELNLQTSTYASNIQSNEPKSLPVLLCIHFYKAFHLLIQSGPSVFGSAITREIWN